MAISITEAQSIWRGEIQRIAQQLEDHLHASLRSGLIADSDAQTVLSEYHSFLNLIGETLIKANSSSPGWDAVVGAMAGVDVLQNRLHAVANSINGLVWAAFFAGSRNPDAFAEIERGKLKKRAALSREKKAAKWLSRTEVDETILLVLGSNSLPKAAAPRDRALTAINHKLQAKAVESGRKARPLNADTVNKYCRRLKKADH
jgi:hypothetical protein